MDRALDEIIGKRHVRAFLPNFHSLLTMRESLTYRISTLTDVLTRKPKIVEEKTGAEIIGRVTAQER